MQNFFLMDVFESKAQLYEPVQYEGMLKNLTALSYALDSLLEVTSFTVVHNNAEVVLLYKWVMVLNYVCMVKLSENLDFVIYGFTTIACFKI